MVALGQHRDDLDGYGAVIGVMHGGGRTPLSAIWLCEMGITPKKALDIYESSYLTISYLLRGE